jgi:predicted alpha/beta superfamily hydrolase
MSLIKSRKSKQEVSETATPVVSGGLRLHELRSRIFRNTRLLRVWLPPDYDVAGTIRYPVLYLNDGQNLFDPATAFAGVDWRVGEAASRLIHEGKIPPLIIVGIDNTGKNRVREYIPYRPLDLRLLGAQGKRYPEFLVREVMPLIAKHYAVAKGPENTGLGGSSLGGLITLYTHLASPGVFGRLLIESPSLFVGGRKILEESRRFRDWPYRVYLGMGTREVGSAVKDEKTVADVRELESILQSAGLGTSRLRVHIEEGATHNEAAWGARFPAALEFLYRAQVAGGSSH